MSCLGQNRNDEKGKSGRIYLYEAENGRFILFAARGTAKMIHLPLSPPEIRIYLALDAYRARGLNWVGDLKRTEAAILVFRASTVVPAAPVRCSRWFDGKNADGSLSRPGTGPQSGKPYLS
jgi:hypothetical protein